MGRKGDLYLRNYGIVLFLVMCGTMNLSFTWSIPTSLLLVMGIASSLLYLMLSGVARQARTSVDILLLLFFICFYMFAISPNQLTGFLIYGSLYFCAFTILMLSAEKKAVLLDIFTKGTALIILVSLPPWILYLLGVPLPHGESFLFDNNFHILTNYYFFVLNGVPGQQEFPRFASMFLEPGQLATPCAFLFFANNGSWRKKENILLVLAILFSFSLIGYGLLFGGLLLHSFLASKRFRLLKGGMLLLLFSAVTVITIQSDDQDNPLNAFIINRLQFDDERLITGNNRTTEFFDERFELMMKSDDKYVGIANTIDPNNNWTSNTSGIKKFIVMYGLVGLILVFVFFIRYFLKYRSSSSFVFLIVLVVGFIPRSMVLTPFWFFVSLLAFPVLKAKALSLTSNNRDIMSREVVNR